VLRISGRHSRSPRRLLHNRGARDQLQAGSHNAIIGFARATAMRLFITNVAPSTARPGPPLEMCATKHQHIAPCQWIREKATGRNQARGEQQMSCAPEKDARASAGRTKKERHSNIWARRDKRKGRGGGRVPRGNSSNDMVNATGHAVTRSHSARINGRIVALKRPNHAARSIAAQRQSAHAKHAQLACEKNVTRRAQKKPRRLNNQTATNVNSPELRARASY